MCAVGKLYYLKKNSHYLKIFTSSSIAIRRGNYTLLSMISQFHDGLLHHILSRIAYTVRKNREFVFIIIVQFMMSANSRMRFALQIALVCLYSTPSHYHHCANLSEDIEIAKCLSDIFCRVCEKD